MTAAMESPTRSVTKSKAESVAIDMASPTDTYVKYADLPPYARIRVNRMLYTSACLGFLQAIHYGWSLSQLNLSTFNNKHDCSVRPIVHGTCLMFPGHTKAQWTLVVNVWMLTGMIGALGSGMVTERFGRKKTLYANAIVMAVGAIVQASSSSLGMFAAGRAIAGFATGIATATGNGYVGDIAPPHLRSKLGVGYQIALGIGFLALGVTFFFTSSSTGWRYIAGFPIVLAAAFWALAPWFMVESPAWLLNHGRQEEAERELAKLYGQDGVPLALSWMQPPPAPVAADGALPKRHNPWKALFSPTYRLQTIIAICMPLSLQFSGITAVFMYSSSLFKEAGVSDTRIGSVIIYTVHLLPAFGAGSIVARFGNRKMMIWGQVAMLACAIGLTISLLFDASALSIAFTALYVLAFAMALGPLAFAVAVAMFPSHLRASGLAVTLTLNWLAALTIGIGYPYVADALGDWGFLPFISTITLFMLFFIKFVPEITGKTSDEIQALFRKQGEVQ